MKSQTTHTAKSRFGFKGADELTIVVAWSDEGSELEREGRIDIGEHHKWRPIIVGKAAVWLRRGKFDDFLKAQAHAEKEETRAANEPAWARGNVPRIWRVFTYPTSEKDPLGKARKEIVKLAEHERAR